MIRSNTSYLMLYTHICKQLKFYKRKLAKVISNNYLIDGFIKGLFKIVQNNINSRIWCQAATLERTSKLSILGLP